MSDIVDQCTIRNMSTPHAERDTKSKVKKRKSKVIKLVGAQSNIAVSETSKLLVKNVLKRNITNVIAAEATKKRKLHDDKVLEKREEQQKTPSTTLHVANVNYTVIPHVLRAAFKNSVSATIPRHKSTSKSKGFAFVEFNNTEDASNALEEMHNKEFEGRTLFVSFHNETVNTKPSKSLIVRNLSIKTTKDILEKIYSKSTKVHIPHDRKSGRSRGFAFVNFKTIDAAIIALNRTNGSKIDKSRVIVSFSDEQENRKKGKASTKLGRRR